MPVSSTDGPFNVVAWAFDRRDAVGTAVLVDTQYLGDMRPFVAGADPHFEGFSWLYGVDTALGQNAPM